MRLPRSAAIQPFPWASTPGPHAGPAPGAKLQCLHWMDQPLGPGCLSKSLKSSRREKNYVGVVLGCLGQPQMAAPDGPREAQMAPHGLRWPRSRGLWGCLFALVDPRAQAAPWGSIWRHLWTLWVGSQTPIQGVHATTSAPQTPTPYAYAVGGLREDCSGVHSLWT